MSVHCALQSGPAKGTRETPFWFPKEALSIFNPTEVWVYARASQVPKLRVLKRYFWGDRFGTVKFIPCADLKPLRFRLVDRYLMTFLAWVDPEARGIGGLSSKPWFRRIFFYPTPSPKK